MNKSRKFKQLHSQEHITNDLVIPYRKRWMIFSVALVTFTALIVWFISYFFSHIFALSLAPLYFAILLFFTFPWLWRACYALLLRQPAFIANRAGIQIFPLHIPISLFIRWSEIQRIAVNQHASNKYICIYPKENREYLSHLSTFKRLVVRLWNPKSQPIISILILYLDRSSIEISQQLSHKYANELREHNIQLEL